MTVKIKVLPRSTVKVKGATRLVGRVIAGNGTLVTESAGNFTVAVDFDSNQIVTGPVSADDNAVVRWNGTDGTVLQNSPMIVTDAGLVSGVTWNGETIAAIYGGTGQSSYTIGDMLYASTSTELRRLAASTSGYALLANGAGVASSYQGFLLAATGATTRTWNDALSEQIFATHFANVFPTGLSASTVGLQAWIDHIYTNNKLGLLPPGTYTHTGLSRAGNGNALRILGAGVKVTKLVNTSLTASDITLDCTAAGMNGVLIHGINFEPSVTKTAGAAINQIGEAGITGLSEFSHLVFGEGCFNAIGISSGLDITIRDIVIQKIGQNARGISLVGTAGSGGILFGIINNVKIENVTFKDGVTGGGGGVTTAIYIDDYVFGVHGQSNQIGGGPNFIDYGYWIATTSTSISVSNYIHFENSGADAVAKNPIRIDGGTDVSFSGGFIQNSGNGFDAVLITGGSLVSITNNSINGGQRNGVSVTGGNQIKILDNTLYHNGYEGGGSNVYSDIKVANSVGTNAVTISGNTFGFTGTTPVAKYNVEIVGPTNDNYVIGPNNYGNFVTAAVQDGGTGANDEPTFRFPASMNFAGKTITGAPTFQAVASEALAVRSGGAASFTYLGVGRTAVDVQYGVAGLANHFFTGTAQGDAVINATGDLWLGKGGSPGLRVSTSGALRASALGTGLLHADASGNLTSSAAVNADLDNMAQTTIKGRAVGAGTGAPTDLTATQAAAIIGSVGGALKSKIITITRDLTVATGSVGYTGVGFTPTAMIAIGMVAGSISQYIVVNGMVDSSLFEVNAYLGGTVLGVEGSTFLLFQDSSAAHNQAATVASFDADGFTLSWTKTGTPTGTATIRVLCFR